jgi:hypothetical protein
MNAERRRGECDEQQGAHPVVEAGGDAACWAHLLCPECGVVLDGGAHAKDCTFRFERTKN